MKVFIVLAVIVGIVGVWAQASPETTTSNENVQTSTAGGEANPTTTVTPASDQTTAEPVTTHSSPSDASTETPGSTEAPKSTEAPPSTLSPPTTQEAPTGGPTVENPSTQGEGQSTQGGGGPTTLATSPTPPLKRDVNFNIDCTANSGTQCKFQFQIAEQLMRFVNETQLKNVLTDLTSKIQTIAGETTQVSNSESAYITDLQSKIHTLSGNVDTLMGNINGTDATDLQEKAQAASDTASNYLSAAYCFRNDQSPSEYCGSLAFPGA